MRHEQTTDRWKTKHPTATSSNGRNKARPILLVTTICSALNPMKKYDKICGTNKIQLYSIGLEPYIQFFSCVLLVSSINHHGSPRHFSNQRV